MTLRPGDKGVDVGKLQWELNKHGAELVVDGVFGGLTKAALMEFQVTNGLKPDGVAGPKTWDMLLHGGGGSVQISDAAKNLIIDFEVGGGRQYYEKRLAFPTWPEGASGVTIGIGYDLGYDPIDPWMGKLDWTSVKRLSNVVGATGMRAAKLVSSVRDVYVPWVSAVEVFEEHTLPTEARKAKQCFPGIENLHPDVQGVLVSLVFNRGPGMNGDRRAEMRQIKNCVEVGDVRGIADALVRMKRLWPKVKGLRLRRDAEAAMVRASYVAGPVA